MCKKAKYDRRPYKIELADMPAPRKPFDVLHMDVFISRPCMYLSAVDKLSKFGILIPLKSRSIPDVRRALLNLTSTFGLPKLIVCDNEPSFKSVEIRGLMQSLDVEMCFVPVNHSEANGIVERFHSTLAEIFRCVKDRHADLTMNETFRLALTHYNGTIHSATKMRPIEVFFGIRSDEERPLNLELMLENRNKVFDEVIGELESKQRKDHDYHNATKEKEPELHEGEVVYLKRQGVKSKTQPQFLPVEVAENRRKTFIDTGGRKLHKENLKRRPRT